MIYGLTNESKRIKAAPGVKAQCPSCKEDLIPKCGEIRVWHFAHHSIEDCDAWHQTETEWHIDWKNLFSIAEQEIYLGQHWADVKCNGIVIEFQHSAISEIEIRDREHFYQKMIWVLDATQWDFKWQAIESLDRERFYIVFWLDKLLSAWRRACAPILFHMGGKEIIWVRDIDWSNGYGTGIYIRQDFLIERFGKGNFERPTNNLYKK